MKKSIIIGALALITLAACQNESNEVVENTSKTETSTTATRPGVGPINDAFLKEMQDSTGLSVASKKACLTVESWHTEYIYTYTVSCGGTLWEVQYYVGFGWGSPRQIN
ncbi:hypothetical protein [Chryseobacterium sp.]|uniref:hypothetical protein n=1 Tax=Chryseobacterium sp. TaxID=1871047 RepID=UPI0024E1F1AF|nr:hypothetical protein [Chryseobacterium sp.]